MQKKYIYPEITVKRFSSDVHTANGTLPDTSAVKQAKEYLNNNKQELKIKQVIVMQQQ